MIESLLEFDLFLFSAINGGTNIPILDDILIILRNKFVWIPFYLFILSYILLNYNVKKWLIVGFLLLSVILSDGFSSQFIKKTTKRLRPCHVEGTTANVRINCGQGYSFPSSHASNHFSIATFLFLLFSWLPMRHLLFLWASLISLAQIYVGVHYPSDILVGAILGILIGYVSYRIFDSLAQILFDQKKDIHVL